MGATHVAATTEADNFTHVPAERDLKLTDNAAYVHVTSNNTIYGTQWRRLPDVGGRVLVQRRSSDIFSQTYRGRTAGVIYAGRRRTLRRRDDACHHPEDICSSDRRRRCRRCELQLHAEHDSLSHPPVSRSTCCVSIEVAARQWRPRRDGRAETSGRPICCTPRSKSDRVLPRSRQPDSRSWMNVTFRFRMRISRSSSSRNQRQPPRRAQRTSLGGWPSRVDL